MRARYSTYLLEVAAYIIQKNTAKAVKRHPNEYRKVLIATSIHIYINIAYRKKVL